jgi:NAD(P) transhydrogenase subunit alpha
MKLAIPKETRAHERRVAASPESAKRLVAMGLEVLVESGAGLGASYTDDAYRAAGASIVEDTGALYHDADIVLKVQRPQPGDEVARLKHGAVLIGILQPLQHRDEASSWAAAGLTSFAVDLLPRITRAQAMDVLSSQSNLAGYKAVVDAAAAYGHAFPMMMTAAGTVPPARVVVMGAGVAGLQAIATARRLGAIVSAFDVRAVAKEQVQSLGATFIEVDANAQDAETAGGYAREMGEDYQRRQREKVHETLKKQDIAICTALIPGRQAPVLITAEMIADMKPGSVIVDLAAEAGGNAEGTKYGETVVTANGVTIIGPANMPSQIATDASALYARNLVAFLGLIVDKETGQIKLDMNDEIIKGTLVTHQGNIVHPSLAAAPAVE